MSHEGNFMVGGNLPNNIAVKICLPEKSQFLPKLNINTAVEMLWSRLRGEHDRTVWVSINGGQ